MKTLLFLSLLLTGCVSRSQFIKYAQTPLSLAHAIEKAMRKAFRDLETMEYRIKRLENRLDELVVKQDVNDVVSDYYKNLTDKAAEKTDKKFKKEIDEKIGGKK